jgi:hypothetical protein
MIKPYYQTQTELELFPDKKIIKVIKRNMKEIEKLFADLEAMRIESIRNPGDNRQTAAIGRRIEYYKQQERGYYETH